ncbi:MAG TPA: hypothetical protein VM531_11095 [Sphingomicrobium sp.]|jgi:hypothetical protein|nr:hypothetical protein [Sphingomicrobium sp.]
MSVVHFYRPILRYVEVGDGEEMAELGDLRAKLWFIRIPLRVAVWLKSWRQEHKA